MLVREDVLPPKSRVDACAPGLGEGYQSLPRVLRPTARDDDRTARGGQPVCDGPDLPWRRSGPGLWLHSGVGGVWDLFAEHISR